MSGMKWISVKDKLPEQSGRYLIYDGDGHMYDCEFDECIGDNGEFGFWQAHYDPYTLGYVDSDWITNENVTHWMPLPEDPEEEN